jgi:membrane-associated phospholipid phosphatase
MRKLRRILILLPFASAAQAQGVGEMMKDDLKNYGTDMWAVWSSPFRASGKSWSDAGLVVLASAAATPIDDDIDRWMLAHQKSWIWTPIQPFREGGIAFNGRYATPAAIGLLGYALLTKNTDVQDGMFGCLSAYTSTSVVRSYVVYPLVGRDRPGGGKDTPPPPPAHEGSQYAFHVPGDMNDWGEHSLPAGHITNVMGCATFLSNRFQIGSVASALMYTAVGGIGLGRLVDRRHWTSDTILGIAFGYAAGREVAKRSLARARDPANAAQTLRAGWRLTF